MFICNSQLVAFLTFFVLELPNFQSLHSLEIVEGSPSVSSTLIILKMRIEPFNHLNFIMVHLCTEMVDLATRICWELVKKDGYIAVWRKPLNNSCYFSRAAGVQPPICDSNNYPDNVWYALFCTFRFTFLSGITYVPTNHIGHFKF